jgi:TRAP-type C4-dicarboxylate transport system permease small subunit
MTQRDGEAASAPSALAVFDHAVQFASRMLAVAGLSILLVLATFTLADGLLRAFANHPLDFVREVGDLVAAVAAASCLPIVVLERGNITLEILKNIFPSGVVRFADLINTAAVNVILAAMAWQFWRYASNVLRGGEMTWLLNVPKAPFWYVIDGILWVAVAAQLSLTLHEVVRFTQGESAS